jgi:hypothetical protein
MADAKKETIRANWKVFLACGVMILSPFQYGVDFGMIGGLQAMVGFLKVLSFYIPPKPSRSIAMRQSPLNRRGGGWITAYCQALEWRSHTASQVDDFLLGTVS